VVFERWRRVGAPRSRRDPAYRGVRTGDARSTVLFAIVAVVLVALIVTLYVATRDKMDEGGTSTRPVDDATAAPASSRSVVVLGDAFSSGAEGSDAPTWPDLVAEATGWSVETYADPAARFAPRGDGVSVADLAEEAADSVDAAEVDTVVVAAGRLDVGKGPKGRTARAASDALQTVRTDFPAASIVLLSNFASGEPTPKGIELAATLESVAVGQGAAYVDATGFLTEDDIDTDGLVPTEEGQERLAQEIQGSLDSL